MKKIRILVFPCGSEIGLEIFRSLRYSTYFELVGGSSVSDHGEFVFEKYIGEIPHIEDPDFESCLIHLTKLEKIDAIYPTMDAVIFKLKEIENSLNCKVISSPLETAEICYSKTKTYNALKDIVKIPNHFSEENAITRWPVFVKPDVGYGSRTVRIISSQEELDGFLSVNTNILIQEFLPGKEYTVDCFTESSGKLLFCGARERKRISNGISVRTEMAFQIQRECEDLATLINQRLKFSGAWFFQVKENEKRELVLMEIACRFGGASGIYRNLGVNFAMLSTFNAFGFPVKIIRNKSVLIMDRALHSKFKVDIKFEEVFVDFDDCLIVDGKVNIQLLSFVYQCKNNNLKLTLLTKHEKNIYDSLDQFSLRQAFDEIIHINKSDNKYRYINNSNAIFIDDSFKERSEVYEFCNIPVFAPDAVECLLN